MLAARRLIEFIFGLALVILSATAVWAEDEIDPETCSYNGFPLYGEVQIVDSFPDLKVQIVSSFPDLRVQVVSSFPDRCGRWQYTNSFPDLKVQFVESFPDIKVQFVESFPGLP